MHEKQNNVNVKVEPRSLHVSYLASIFFEVIKIYTFVYTYVKFTQQWKSSLRFVTARKKYIPELSYGGYVDHICNASGAQATITNIYIVKRFLARVSI